MKDNGATLWSCWVPHRRSIRIGVISDTHVPQVADEPPMEVARAFQGVDLILHAGDIYHPSCLEWLERIAPVRGVEFGAATHFSNDQRVMEKQVIEVCGYRIGMVHYLNLRGIRDDITPGAIKSSPLAEGLLPAALEEVFGHPVDIVVFGDTHEAMVEEEQGVLLVNPGSPNHTHRGEGLGTVALLELGARHRYASVIDLKAVSSQSVAGRPPTS